METILEVSENGWEYTGFVTIKSKNKPTRVNDRTLEVDGVIIEFDEEFIFKEEENNE